MRTAIQSSILTAAIVALSSTGASALSASFSWNGIAACSSQSPAFSIKNAPKGTAALRFTMRDYDAPNFNHGGSTVAYSGKGNVASGAISYIGPCPPSGQKHRYVWTIEAMDASGQILGQATAQGQFPR